MQGTAGAIEAAGMGPVMHLAIGGGNIRLPSVARPTNALVMPPAYDNSFTEVMIGPEGADTMVELRGEWKDRIKIEAAIAEAVAIPQNWELATTHVTDRRLEFDMACAAAEGVQCAACMRWTVAFTTTDTFTMTWACLHGMRPFSVTRDSRWGTSWRVHAGLGGLAGDEESAPSFGHLRILPADLSELGSGLRVDRRRALLCGPCACDGRSERRRSLVQVARPSRGGI